MSNATKVPVIIKDSQVTVIVNNQPHTFKNTHNKYEKIVTAIKEENWDEVIGLVDIKRAITSFAKGTIEIKGGQLFHNNEMINNSLATRIVKMAEGGFDVSAIINFLNNLMQNASFRSVNELYSFLEKNDLPITEDGCFIAYKKIRKQADGTFVDIYTGKLCNDVGTTVKMDRNKVDDDSNRTCSVGLHVCSYNYLKNYGSSNDPIVLVKVNPKDVVAVPKDYNDTKMRVCEYTVLSVFGTDDTAEEEMPVVVSTDGLVASTDGATAA